MIFTTKYANQNLIKTSFLNYLLYLVSSPIVFISKRLGFSPNNLTILSIVSCALARMTNKVSSNKLNFDHLSDLFKIFLLSLCLCLLHNNKILFIVAFSFIFLMLFNEVIRGKIDSQNIKSQKSFIETKLKTRLNPSLTILIQQVYNTFFIFHGHSLILFLFMPISEDFAIIGLLYFSFLSFKSVLINIYKQNV